MHHYIMFSAQNQTNILIKIKDKIQDRTTVDGHNLQATLAQDFNRAYMISIDGNKQTLSQFVLSCHHITRSQHKNIN